MTITTPAVKSHGIKNLSDALDYVHFAKPYDEFAQDTVRDVREALESGPKGTMRQWFTARHGKTVTTIQCESTDKPGRWMPTGRTIDAETFFGRVLLSGSARDYRGMRVLHATSRVLIVADDWHTIAYRIED